MELQIVAHACLAVRAAGVRLVVDPWVEGPVYWGSWWHWPEPVLAPDFFDADFIYLTHWHFDHFHEESLQRFNKRAHVLVAAFPVSAMVKHLRKLGFTQVTELPQAGSFDLAPGFRLTSYQVRHEDDSVAVIEADGAVIVDLNDAKPMASTWKLLRARHPRVDFMLRSHSPAWSYPTCYTFEDASQKFEVSRRSYVDAFIAAARILQPRHAVPFASGVCHLHRDVISQNDAMVTTDQVAAVWNEDAHPGTELTIMPAGSSWSTADGFSLTTAPDIAAHVQRLTEREASRLESIYRAEEGRTCSFETFNAFFGEFFRRGGWASRWVDAHWAFRLTRNGREEFWCADFRRRQVTRQETLPDSVTSVITVPEALLEDALQRYIVTNIDISKRWRVHIRRGGAMRHVVAMILLGWFEAGYCDPGSILTRRAMVGLLRRYPEAIDYATIGLHLLKRDQDAVTRAVTDPL